MKKLLSILILAILPIAGMFAQESERGGASAMPFQLDVTAFISYGIIENDSASDLDALAVFMASLRGGSTVIFRYEFTDFLSAGIEAGLAYISTDYDTYFDIPLNAIARLGFDGISVEGHAGYYASNFSDLSGPSIGAKGLLGGWYVDASVIFAPITYTRYTFGFQLNNLL